jgi:hypothetical protein
MTNNENKLDTRFLVGQNKVLFFSKIILVYLDGACQELSENIYKVILSKYEK